jgi:hypothetical protein
MFNNNEQNENTPHQVNPLLGMAGAVLLLPFGAAIAVLVLGGMFFREGIPWALSHVGTALLIVFMWTISISIVVFAVRFVLRLWKNRPSS